MKRRDFLTATGAGCSLVVLADLVDLDNGVLVAGGGLICVAISAARHGAKVVLVQDRSRLGGNSSSEVKMHAAGTDSHKGRGGWREGGVLEQRDQRARLRTSVQEYGWRMGLAHRNKGNHQRMVRHRFTPVETKAMRVQVTAINGDELARIFEVRCYA